MRVIAGTAKGRKLRSVPGSTTRPITDRVKRSLFDVLGTRVIEARFLDLFAGTGSVGIEALSRGAALAVFVERAPRAIQVIRENLRITGLADQARVVRMDVFAFLQRDPASQGGPFHIIHIAPPQYRELWARTLQALDETDFLVPGGLAVAQIHPKEYEPLALSSLSLVDQRRYGSTLLCFYEKL